METMETMETALQQTSPAKATWKTFILDRRADYLNKSKLWIVGYAFLFWIITRVLCGILMEGVSAISGSGEVPSFMGNPETLKAHMTLAKGLLLALLVNPILEEAIFRLGLSFKKWQVALSLGIIPAYIAYYGFVHINMIIAVAASLTIFTVIFFLTKQNQWNQLKSRYYGLAIWVSTILFAVVHIFSFGTLTVADIPLVSTVILMMFLGACSITYLRINLGYWWGVGFHIFNNLPAAAALLVL